MPQSQEIELKFLCAPDDLGRVLAAAPAGADDCRELISVYFDTPALDLQKVGASLRVRESEGRRVQTLKRGDGLAREEHEAAIASDAPDPSLGPLPDLLPDGARSELKPAFHVRVTRRQRRVSYDGAEIELALDQGEVRGAKRTSPICEVELELKSGEPSALFGLARELNHAAPLYLSFATKSQRGQALVAGEPLHAHKKARIPPSADASVAEVFQAVARNALESIAANAEVLRHRPDSEAVHQLRVGARTFRSALSTFRKAVEDAEFPRVKAELKWLAGTCDTARNLDVFVAETLRPAAELETKPGGLDALCAAVEAARVKARAEVAQAVGSARFRELLIAATGWADTGSWLGLELAGRPAKPFATHVLDKRRRKLIKAGRRLVDVTDEERHAARIEAKKLRYAVEGFESVFRRKSARRYAGRIKALQDDLGALNDLATAEKLLEQLSLSTEAAFAAGEIVGLKVAAKDAAIRRAVGAMKQVADTDPFWR